MARKVNAAQEMPPQEEMGFGAVQSWLGARFPRYYRLVFGGSFLLALLVHLYTFTNKFVNHDDINSLLFHTLSDSVTSGRWFLFPTTAIAGHFSSPWLDGMVGALFLAAACTIVAALFHVRRLLPAMLLSACMVAFPAVTATYTYMFTSSQYFLALAMALLAAFFIRRETVLCALAGVVFLALSTSIYQSYFAVAVAALVLAMLLDTCQGRWTDDFKGFILTGLRYVGWLVLSMALYFVGVRVSLWLTGLELVDYQGISGMGQLSLHALLTNIKDAYLGLFAHYFHKPVYSFLFSCLVALSFLADGVAVAVMLLSRRLHRHASVLIELALLLLILPLACDLVYVMSGAETVHDVMVYPMVFPLCLPVLLGSSLTSPDFASLFSSRDPARIRRFAAVMSCILLLLQAAFAYQFLIIANRTYTLMDLSYEETYAYLNRLTTKIELQENYTPDTFVAIVGRIPSPVSLPATNITGALTSEGIMNMWSRRLFFTYFLNCPYMWATERQIADATATRIYQEMPCYPSEGSIATINGIIVVKMS